MAAKKKSASRKSAAKKTTKKKAAKKKAPKSRKPRAAARKKVVRKAQVSPAVVDIDNRIAILRNNLRDVTEQAAGYSGAATEELMSNRITDQEAKLAALIKQREKLARG